MSSDLFFIGIDGGGTKCRARLEDVDGNVLGEGVSGPANIMRDSDLAKASIVDAINIAISNAGNANTSEQISLSRCVVGAGLAGANIESARQQFEQWQHPFYSLHVLSDLHAACVGAHNGNPGAAIIIGTGSSGTMWQDESFQDVGALHLIFFTLRSAGRRRNEHYPINLNTPKGITKSCSCREILPETMYPN